jgi:phosphate transport system substrate-binding protein
MRPFAAVLLLIGVLAQNSPAAEPLVWAGCGITEKAFMAELAAAYEQQTGNSVQLEGGGATKGIRRVHSLDADMGGTCRPKLRGHPEEANTQLNPVAWDALVAIVHPANPVDDLTLAQLKGIYEGQIINWRQLGGPDQPLELQIRSGKHSGVGRTLRELVFADADQDFVAAAVHRSSPTLEQAVENNANAIGVTGISSARKRKVKVLRLEGRSPTYENIRSGSYLLYRPLYIAYNSSNPRRSDIERFIDFAHSKRGREIIRQQGVVPYLDALHLTGKRRERWRRADQGPPAEGPG